MGSTKLSKRGVNPKRLTDKQRLFIAEYLIDFKGGRAAKAAGYKGRVDVTAAKLLKHPLVSKIIGKAQRQALQALGLRRETILRELVYCALRDPIDLCDKNGRLVIDNLGNLPEQIRRCIDSVKCKQFVVDGEMVQEIELRLTPKLAALELAMKHLGLLAPQQHEVTVGVVDFDNLAGLYEEPQDSMDPIEATIDAIALPVGD